MSVSARAHSEVPITCFGCGKTYHGLDAYWRHDNGEDCDRTGEVFGR